ncbi:replication protein RepA [Spirosoma aerophilum]
MSSDKPPQNILTPNSRVSDRLVQTAYEIASDKATVKEAIYQHSVLCQTFLPYRNPGDDQRVWQQRQGNVSLAVQAGNAFDQDGVMGPIGLPYGTKARLILAHINSEAVKTQSREIDVEGSMSAFIKSIGLSLDGRTIKEVKEQLRRLSTATLSLGFSNGVRGIQYDLHIINTFDLWFPKNEKQRILWPSRVQLSSDYFESLREHAIPLDNRALAALSHNAMALDIYSWLAQRLHRIEPNNVQFIAWENLKSQFGQGYDRMNDFKKVFRKTLLQVRSQYYGAKIEEVPNRGFDLRLSPPPIEPKAMIPGMGTRALPNSAPTIEPDVPKGQKTPK